IKGGLQNSNHAFTLQGLVPKKSFAIVKFFRWQPIVRILVMRNRENFSMDSEENPAQKTRSPVRHEHQIGLHADPNSSNGDSRKRFGSGH
ncbi:MAG: hypothetical protein ACOZB3_01185, partial [Calditrichota bacterium]